MSKTFYDVGVIDKYTWIRICKDLKLLDNYIESINNNTKSIGLNRKTELSIIGSVTELKDLLDTYKNKFIIVRGNGVKQSKYVLELVIYG